jgi:hypothetical protein
MWIYVYDLHIVMWLKVTLARVLIGNQLYCTLKTCNYRYYTAITNSLQHTLSLLSLLCLHRLSPGNTPNTIDPSAFMFSGFCPSWLAAISPLNYVSLHNGLQQWVLLCLPHLCQGRLSQPQAVLECLPPNSNSTWLSTDSCVQSLQI